MNRPSLVSVIVHALSLMIKMYSFNSADISAWFVSYSAFAVVTPPLVGGRGFVFARFLCFFVSSITRKRLD